MDGTLVCSVRYKGKGPAIVAGVYMCKTGQVYSVPLSSPQMERLLDAKIASGIVERAAMPTTVQPAEPEVRIAAVPSETQDQDESKKTVTISKKK